MNVSKGLYCDIHPTAQPDNTIRDCYDGYVTVGSTGGVWKPVEGTMELPIAIGGVVQNPFNQRVMATVQVGLRRIWIAMDDNHHVMFYSRTITSNQVNLILLAEFNAVDFFSIQLAGEGAPPNYDAFELGDCFGISDGDGNDFVYTTTGVNQPLCIPIGQSLSTISIGQCRYLPEASGLKVNAYVVVGSLPSGSYTFLCQLYREDGTTSQWSMPTPFRSLTQQVWAASFDPVIRPSNLHLIDCTLNGLSGGGVTDSTSSGFRLTIDGDKTGYEKVRIACFNRGKDGASTVGYICYEAMIGDDPIYYVLENKLRPILLSDVLVQPTELHNVKSIDYYKDVQVVGGFKEIDGLSDGERYRVDNGEFVDTLRPTLSVVERKVKQMLNSIEQSTLVDPYIEYLQKPVFAPNEDYELAVLPVSISGSRGNAIRIGRVHIPDSIVDEVTKQQNVKHVRIENETDGSDPKLYSYTFPVKDISVSNLDVSPFDSSVVDHLELLYRNVSERVVGYGVARSVVTWNDENAGGILPQTISWWYGSNGTSTTTVLDAYKGMVSDCIVMNIPEHLFGLMEASQFKDLEVEFYNAHTYMIHSWEKNLVDYSVNSPLTCGAWTGITNTRSNEPALKSRFKIVSVQELKYDGDKNSIIFPGLPGARRNSGRVTSSNACWSYGQKSLLVRLDGSCISTASTLYGFFGYCRVVNTLQRNDNSFSYRSSGITIPLTGYTESSKQVVGRDTTVKIAQPITLQVGDRYPRIVSVCTLIPNLEKPRFRNESEGEVITFATYSKLDVTCRVGATYNNTKFFETSNHSGIGLNSDTGYVKLEQYSLHDHYVDGTPFSYSSISEELRTSMQQHIRWAVKRTVNSRVNELRRFLANDIVAADLGGGSVTAIRFLNDVLVVVQERSVGRMPYNERIPISNKSEIFLGTGKEFGSYYRILADGTGNPKAIAIMGSDIVVGLTANGAVVSVNGSVNSGIEIPRIDLLRNLGVSSHERLSGVVNAITCSPIINGICYLTINNTCVIVSANGSSANAVGITEKLPNLMEVDDGSLYGIPCDDTVLSSKMYIHKKGVATHYGRSLTPWLSVVLSDPQYDTIQPMSIFLEGLVCPVKDIILNSNQQAIGGVWGHDAMERKNHEQRNNGWKLTMPFARYKGCEMRLSGNYLILTLTFPSSSEELVKFGYVNEYIVSNVVKR